MNNCSNHAITVYFLILKCCFYTNTGVLVIYILQNYRRVIIFIENLWYLHYRACKYFKLSVEEISTDWKSKAQVKYTSLSGDTRYPLVLFYLTEIHDKNINITCYVLFNFCFEKSSLLFETMGIGYTHFLLYIKLFQDNLTRYNIGIGGAQY